MSGQFQFYDDSFMAHGSFSIIMGTRFDLILLGKSKPVSEIIWKRIVTELQRLDKMLNRFDPKSELSYINSNAYKSPISVSEEMWDILCDCKSYYKKTEGLFDITLKDFSQVNFDGENRSIEFYLSDLFLDLGGYAKGYALKKIQTILDDEKVNQAFVDFGNSSILAIGHHPYGNSWQVSILNPFEKGKTLGEVDLIDKSFSTSGNTPSHLQHIINPLTGIYTRCNKVTCVVSENPVKAEVLSTVLMIATKSQCETISKQLEVDYFKIFNLS